MSLFIIHYLSFIIQKLAEFRNSTGTMANMVLDVHTKFGKCLVVAVWLKDRVVAEALPSSALTDNLPFDNALKLMDFLN